MIEANRASSSAYEVSMMHAVFGIWARMSRHTSTPLPSGSRTSSMATSGCRAGIRLRASATVPASPTTSRSSVDSRRDRRPVRTISWSSRRNTRIVIAAHLTTSGPVHGWSAPVGAVTLVPVPDDSPRRRAAYDSIEDPVKLRRVLEATLLLEADLHLGDLLTHIVDEARSLSGARYGALGVLDEEGKATVEFLASGLETDVEARLLQGPLPTGKGVLGLLISDPRPIRVPVIGDHPASAGFPPGHPPMRSFLGTPIKVHGRVYGNLYLTEKIGADEFSPDDEAVIEALALAAGIAVENARLHQRAGEVAVYEDRDRLARDLHDGVIQRLFAIGLLLQGLSVSPAGSGVADSLSAAVGDIDETIRQVRATIFELGGAGGGRGVRAHVVALAEELRPVVGFDVPVDFHGPVDTAVTDTVAEQLLPTLREALTNIGRHAEATRARVRLSIDRQPVPARDHRQRSGPAGDTDLRRRPGPAQHAPTGRGSRRHVRGDPPRGGRHHPRLAGPGLPEPPRPDHRRLKVPRGRDQLPWVTWVSLRSVDGGAGWHAPAARSTR